MILLLHELTLLSSILRLAKALILLEMNHASASIILFVLNGNKNENSAFQHVTHLQTTFQWMADLSFCRNHIFCLNYTCCYVFQKIHPKCLTIQQLYFLLKNGWPTCVQLFRIWNDFKILMTIYYHLSHDIHKYILRKWEKEACNICPIYQFLIFQTVKKKKKQIATVYYLVCNLHT